MGGSQGRVQGDSRGQVKTSDKVALVRQPYSTIERRRGHGLHTEYWSDPGTCPVAKNDNSLGHFF